jgi:hypothetical protein
VSKPPYIPRSVRGVELRTPALPHEPKYQEIPQNRHEGTEARRHEGSDEGNSLEATRVPSGPHKGKTLLQLLNDHPGYLLHLNEQSFTDNEEFEMKVEEFCEKYQHRLARATGGSSTSILWAASIAAVRRESDQVRFNSAVVILEAIDFTAATTSAEQKARERWPGGEYSVAVENIPLADLRRALKAEMPQKGVSHR